MTKLRILPAVVLALVFTVATPSWGDTFRVKATGSNGDYSWSPVSRHAPKGSKIVWKNKSDAAHRIKSYGSNWSYDKELPKDGRASKTFTKTGTFKFRCTVPGHSSLVGNECNGMCGEIFVHKP